MAIELEGVDIFDYSKWEAASAKFSPEKSSFSEVIFKSERENRVSLAGRVEELPSPNGNILFLFKRVSPF